MEIQGKEQYLRNGRLVDACIWPDGFVTEVGIGGEEVKMYIDDRLTLFDALKSGESPEDGGRRLVRSWRRL